MPSLIFQSDAHRHLVEALVNRGRWGGDGGGDGSSQQRNAPSGVLGAESASSTPLRSSPAVKSSKQPSVSARRVSSTTSPAISPAPVGAVTPKGRSKSRVAEDSGAAEDRLPPWVEFRDAILVPAVEKALDLAYRNRSQYVPNGKSADGRTTAPQGNQNNNGENSNGGGDSSSSLLKGHPSTPIIMRKLLSSNEGSSPSFNDNEKELPGVVMPIVFNEDDFLLENAEILNEVRGFSAPPFTLQRLCEILLDHEKHHVTSAAGGGGGSSVAGSGKAEEPESPVVGTPGGNKGGKKRQRSNTPTRGTPSSAAAASSSSAPRIRGEKLQAALRRCALVSTTI